MAQRKSPIETAVVDTMVFAYALLGVTRYREDAAAALESVGAIVVPDTFHSELTNVVWQWLRAEKLAPEVGAECLRDAAALIACVETAESLWERALALALDAQHPAYDMMFVAAAERFGSPLITYDKKLARFFPELVMSPDALAAGRLM